MPMCSRNHQPSAVLFDTPLCPSASSECKAKAMQLSNIEFSLILVSPFRRTLETADLLIPHLKVSKDLEIYVHKSLSEVASVDIMLNGQATLCGRLEVWGWRRRRRDQILPRHSISEI